MTTSHQLAKLLLEGPDKPVILGLVCAHDAVFSTKTDEDEEDARSPVDEDLKVKDADECVEISVYMPDSDFGWRD